MKQYLPYVIVGLSSGSAYALAAMGLVVTYTTSGIFNFAHGAVGMIATFVFYSLRVDAGLPTWLAAGIVVLLFAPAMGAAIDRLFLRGLAGAPAYTYVVASLGLLVALQGLAVALYGPSTRQIAGFLPHSTFRLFDLNVGWDQAILVLIAGTTLIGLIVFFERTHLGLQMRAVVDDPDLTDVFGTDPRRITMFSWMLGCSLAALAGVLLAPAVGVDAALLTLFVVQAFASAAVGRLTSLRGAYVGALGIGVAAALSTKFVAQMPQLQGLPSGLPFIVLFVVLVASPKGRFAEIARAARVDGSRRRVDRAKLPAPSILLAASLALVVLPWGLNGAHLLTATLTLVFLLIFASLGLLVGLSRQISLCHAVFVALGATTLSHLLNAGVPFLVGLPIASLVVVPIGALIAFPAVRLSGLFLALATFGFGLLVQSLIFPTSLGFGASGVVSVPRPAALASDRAYYWFVLLIVVLGVIAIEALRRTRLGRFVRALADSPTAVESLGVRSTASRVVVFCTSAFLAAIAGGLLGGLYHSVSPVTFDFFQSLIWLAVLVGAGAASLGGSVLAAVLLVTLPVVVTASWLTDYQPVAFGLGAILLAQAPNGIAGLFRIPDFGRLAERSRRRLETSPAAERSGSARISVPTVAATDASGRAG